MAKSNMNQKEFQELYGFTDEECQLIKEIVVCKYRRYHETEEHITIGKIISIEDIKHEKV